MADQDAEISGKLKICQYLHDEYEEIYTVEFAPEELMEVAGNITRNTLDSYVSQDFLGLLTLTDGKFISNVLDFGGRKGFLEHLEFKVKILETTRDRIHKPQEGSHISEANFVHGSRIRRV